MPHIKVKDAILDYPIYHSTGRSLRHALFMNPIKTAIAGAQHVGGTITRDEKSVVVRSLDGVSFDVGDGERVGLIGQNGAGKSTLLKAMAGIYEPNAGSITTEGKVVTLLNITEGQSPEATGRELIETRGVLLGLSPPQRQKLADDVIEFCELGDYIEMPVRTYSSGMQVRLSFAIATSLKADILLFDELIGAGDARFYEKAKARLGKFINSASIMIVATHSPDILLQWCSRCLLMEHGKIIMDGPVEDVLAAYGEKRAVEIEVDGAPYLQPAKPLQAADAAVALIVDERGRYLVQLRDSTPEIFFPEHWGCFGGALEPGETFEAALIREVREELSLDLSKISFSEFTDFTFDFGYAGGGVISRRFFEVPLENQHLEKIRLGEGRDMQWITGPDLLKHHVVVPYDRFAIWMHCYRDGMAMAPA